VPGAQVTFKNKADYKFCTTGRFASCHQFPGGRHPVLTRKASFTEAKEAFSA